MSEEVVETIITEEEVYDNVSKQETSKKYSDYEYYSYQNSNYLVLNKCKILANSENSSYCLDKNITIYLLQGDDDDFLVMLEIGDKVARGYSVSKNNPFMAFDMFYTIKESYR